NRDRARLRARASPRPPRSRRRRRSAGARRGRRRTHHRPRRRRRPAREPPPPRPEPSVAERGMNATIIRAAGDGDRPVSVEPGLAAPLPQRLLEDPEPALAAAADRHARAIAPLLPSADRERLVSAALARANGLGPIEPLLADPEVTELLVNAGTD